MKEKNIKISIIGLGYVGLPLAVAFAEKFRVIGYDTDQSRIKELNNGNDKLEVGNDLLKSVDQIFLLHQIFLKQVNVTFILLPFLLQ